MAVITGVFSLVIGVLFVLGKDTVLPGPVRRLIQAQAAQSLQRPVIAKCVRSATNP